VSKDSFALLFLSVWKGLNFVQLMGNGFAVTGIYPVASSKFLSMLPPEKVPLGNSVTEKEDDFRALISTLRNLGVSEEAIAQNVRDILLRMQGKTPSDVFAEELAKVVHEKKINRRNPTVNRRVKPSFGEILMLESNLEAAVEKRSKSSAANKKSSAAEKKPRGRPKKKQ